MYIMVTPKRVGEIDPLSIRVREKRMIILRFDRSPNLKLNQLETAFKSIFANMFFSYSL